MTNSNFARGCVNSSDINCVVASAAPDCNTGALSVDVDNICAFAAADINILESGSGDSIVGVIGDNAVFRIFISNIFFVDIVSLSSNEVNRIRAGCAVLDIRQNVFSSSRRIDCCPINLGYARCYIINSEAVIGGKIDNIICTIISANAGGNIPAVSFNRFARRNYDNVARAEAVNRIVAAVCTSGIIIDVIAESLVRFNANCIGDTVTVTFDCDAFGGFGEEDQVTARATVNIGILSGNGNLINATTAGYSYIFAGARDKVTAVARID